MTARKIIFTVLALALITIPSTVLAQGHHGGNGQGPGDGTGQGPGGFFGHGRGHGGFGPQMLLGRLADRLELTEEQRLEIEVIYEACRERTTGLREQLQAVREEHRANHELGVFDESEARAFAETVAGLEADLMIEHMRANAEAFNVLTPEQQDELRDLLDEFGDLFGGRHKGGRRCTGRS